MSLAILEAEKAFDSNEVPVGAIIVQEDNIIGKGRNRVIANQNVTLNFCFAKSQPFSRDL